MAGKAFTFMSWDSGRWTDPAKPLASQPVRTELGHGFWGGKAKYFINENLTSVISLAWLKVGPLS